MNQAHLLDIVWRQRGGPEHSQRAGGKERKKEGEREREKQEGDEGCRANDTEGRSGSKCESDVETEREGPK